MSHNCPRGVTKEIQRTSVKLGLDQRAPAPSSVTVHAAEAGLSIHGAGRELPADLQVAFSDCFARRILVPIDFTESSQRALSCAVSLARQLCAELVLLHVFEPVPPSLKILESTFADSSFREQAAQELAQWHSRVPRDLDSKAVLRNGRSAHREIINAAAQHKIDLIVLGRHGRKAFERSLLGSTAGHVLKNAHCAVLVTAPE